MNEITHSPPSGPLPRLETRHAQGLDAFPGRRRLRTAAQRRRANRRERDDLMSTFYAVRAVPVRNAQGSIAGWVRVDLFADGSKPTDMVVLRDGSAFGQADAAERIALDPTLLYPTL